MMTNFRRIISIFLLFGLLSTQVACSWVKSWFPDKEKEYKYSTEIPPLDIPPDLSSSTIEDPTIQPVTTAGQPRLSGPGSAGSGVGEGAKAAEPSESQDPLVRKSGPGALEINQPFPQAWRLIEKALSRQAIEVTDRDRSRGLYYVLYQETEEGAAEEGSLWGEFVFFLGRGSKRETEYRVMLEETGGVTKVSILDKEGVQLTQGPGLRLLNMIKEALESKEELESET